MPPVTRQPWIALLGIVAWSAAAAEPCPAGVELSGDPAAVGAVGELLAARGVALATTECGVVRARIARRDNGLAIEVDPGDGTHVDRIAGEAHTAATVIESFLRSDVQDPLLAARAVPSASPSPRADVEVPPPATPMLRATRGVHLLSALETSYASDRTSWVGLHLGACVSLGPICAAARLRASGVVDGPGVWKGDVQGNIERRSIDLLVGIDIPFAVRGWTLSPGFAAGIGQLHTRGATREVREDTGRACADVHVALSIPLRARLALDLFGAADLMQATRLEEDSPMTSGVELPDEPRFLVRVGLGLRYGGL